MEQSVKKNSTEYDNNDDNVIIWYEDLLMMMCFASNSCFVGRELSCL